MQPGRYRQVKSVCVFCASSNGHNPAYAQAARSLGTAVAKQGLRLIYGGSRVGLMEWLAGAALAAGGEVIGVIPQTLVRRELAHDRLTELHTVESMHARKTMMADLSDAFIALPGGYGTLDELCEMLTWAQLGLHYKPLLLLDVDHYFASLLEFFDRAVTEGFLQEVNRRRLLYATEATSALALLQQSHR